MRRTRGSETSQYPEEEKSKEIPSVAASERGGAQTQDQIEQSAREREKGEMTETVSLSEDSI
jgi:hypothetical protein